MNANSIKKYFQILNNGIRLNSPTILTGISVAGLLTTVILAVKATPKAMELLEESDEYLGYKTTSDPLTAVKVAWKPYIPAAIMGSVTIGCIIGANSINLRRNAALVGAYSLLETTAKEYQSKVIETIGDKKERAIKDDVAKDIISKNPVEDKEIIMTDKGTTLCFDVLSGRYFISDMETLKKAQNELNHSLLNDVWMTVNEFYYKLDIKGIPMGEDMGWNSDRLIDLDFSAQIASDGRPCLVVGHYNPPFASFR